MFLDTIVYHPLFSTHVLHPIIDFLQLRIILYLEFPPHAADLYRVCI